MTDELKPEMVAWRYRFEGAKWTVQKNKPEWYRPEQSDIVLEPLYPASAIEALKAENERLRKELIKRGEKEVRSAENKAINWELRATDAEARLAEAVKVIEEFMDITEPASRPAFKDTQYGEEVEELGEWIGYGALISSASASWRDAEIRRYGRALGGEFVVGPCMSVLLSVRDAARAFIEKEKSNG